MAGVKSMLNKFEQIDNMSAGKVKPSVATKPVLQRFQQAKENASTTNTTSSSSSSSSSSTTSPPPNTLPKSGNPSPFRLPGLTGPMPPLKPVTPNNASDKGGRLNVPRAFQNGTESNSSNDKNNNSDQTTPRKDLWTRPKSPAPSTTSSSSNDSTTTTKPPLVPKFPSMSISNHTLTNNNSPSKPPLPPSKPDNNDKPLEKSNYKAAILPKNYQPKTDSIKSNSSNSSTISSSSSSSSSLSSSSNQTANVTSPTSPSPKSPPSSSSTNGGFDFKSQLRKVNPSSSGTPIKRVLSGASSDSSASSSPSSSETPSVSKTPVSVSSSTASTTSSTNTEKPKTPCRVPPIPSTENVEMRSGPKEAEEEEDVVLRKSDGKRFKKIELPFCKPPPTPKKPARPSNVDLKFIRQQLQKLKKGLDVSKDVLPQPAQAPPVIEEDDDDVYSEGMTLQNDPVPPPTPPKKPVQTSRESQRISLIPEMLAEEEEELPVYDDTPMEEEDIYDDAMSEIPINRKPKTSVSSETPSETEQERKKRLKEEANAKKKEEKERREKEKREKEEEKKRKKKEEDEMKLRTKFNVTGHEKMVGEGVIKQDARASGLNLKVKKGQIITIVRLDSNPPNKWLVKADGQMGYVDSQNIEVDPNIIRQTMQSQGQEEEEEFDQPTYDDVPEENGSLPAVPLLEEEEEYDDDEEMIYELCE